MVVLVTIQLPTTQEAALPDVMTAVGFATGLAAAEATGLAAVIAVGAAAAVGLAGAVIAVEGAVGSDVGAIDAGVGGPEHPTTHASPRTPQMRDSREYMWIRFKCATKSPWFDPS